MKQESSNIAVFKVGACSALGLNVRSTHAAFRAGLMHAEDVELAGHAEPLRAARLTTLAPDALLLGRLSALAGRALEDTCEHVGAVCERSRARAFVALPEVDRTMDEALSTALAPILSAYLPTLGASQCHWFHEGRAGFFFALQAALAALAKGSCELALVGGVDSLCATPTLQRLAADGRMLGASPDGTIPGEGAAFALLASPRSAAAHRLERVPSAEVLCAARGREPNHFGQSAANAADGLTGTLRDVRTHPAAAGVRADLLYTCETGERFWAQEFTMAYFRNTPIMPEPFVKTMAAECFGDTGAASGAVLFAVGIHELTRPPRESEVGSSRTLLLCGSSDYGQVGACLVRGRPAVHSRAGDGAL